MPEVMPLAVYPVPLTVTPEMDTFELPVFVTVVVSELVLPIWTLPKLRLDEVTLSVCVAAVPVPLREIVCCDGDPFVASVMDPVEAAAEVGVNTALKFNELPAAIVLDVVSPEMLKPDPLTLTCENDKVALPVFFSVITLELLLPTTTLPNERLVGLADSRASSPVPLKATVVGDPAALLVIEMLPEALPSAVGVKVTENVVLAPALIVVGARLIVYPLPETLAAVMFSAALPVFFRVIV